MLIEGFCFITGIVIENVIFTILSERKLGPKLLGVFAGGRIEEYIPVSNNGASIMSICIVILKDDDNSRYSLLRQKYYLHTYIFELKTLKPQSQN